MVTGNMNTIIRKAAHVGVTTMSITTMKKAAAAGVATIMEKDITMQTKYSSAGEKKLQPTTLAPG